MPHFFVDRSLGRIQVPRGLRAAGWKLTTLAEHYSVPADERIEDVEWLTLCGTMRWPILMKDDRIRRRPPEAAALSSAGVPAFCIGNANLRSQSMIELFLTHTTQIMSLAEGESGLYVLTKTGIRRVEMR